jgi:hypothetical protein
MSKDTITVIDFGVKMDQIHNFDALPSTAKKAFLMATTMTARGFQEVYGSMGRQMIWSCGGYWTALDNTGKFHITSMGGINLETEGNGVQLFVE